MCEFVKLGIFLFMLLCKLGVYVCVCVCVCVCVLCLCNLNVGMCCENVRIMECDRVWHGPVCVGEFVIVFNMFVS